MPDEVKEQINEEKEEESVNKYDSSYYRSIGMPVPNDKLHFFDVGDHIVQHMTQAYDEHGNVIVVEGDKEDLWLSIPQYQDEVGPKNIVRMLEAGADPSILTVNKANAFNGDFSDMTAHSVNELGTIVPGAIDEARKSLDDFNKKFGTSLDMATFLDLYAKGLLKAHVEGVNKGGSSNE